MQGMDLQADQSAGHHEGEACCGQKAHVMEALQSHMDAVTVSCTQRVTGCWRAVRCASSEPLGVLAT